MRRAAHSRIVAVPTTRQGTGRSLAAHTARPASQPQVRLGSLLELDQELEGALGDGSIGIVGLDTRQQLKQEPVGVAKHPLSWRPPQLEQPPVLVHRAGLGPAKCFGCRGREQIPAPQPRSPLLASDRLSRLVLRHRLAQCPEPRRVPLDLRDDFGIGSIHDRRARRLEQPRQRQPMRCGEFQVPTPECGGCDCREAGANLCAYLPIGQRHARSTPRTVLCVFPTAYYASRNTLPSGK